MTFPPAADMIFSENIPIFPRWLDISRQRHAMDGVISNTAAYVASLRPVADMLEQGYPDPQVR